MTRTGHIICAADVPLRGVPAPGMTWVCPRCGQRTTPWCPRCGIDYSDGLMHELLVVDVSYADDKAACRRARFAHGGALRMSADERRTLLLEGGWQRLSARGAEMWTHEREGRVRFTLFTATRRELEREPIGDAS